MNSTPIKTGRIKDAALWVAQEARALLMAGHIDNRHDRRLRAAFEQLQAAFDSEEK